MKPYGAKKDFYSDEDYGPPTRYNQDNRRRKEWRRLLHKKGRSQGRKEINLQLKDLA